MRDVTSIELKKTTKDRLLDIGKKGQSYDDIINNILDKQNP
jgi:hypothetical protein